MTSPLFTPVALGALSLPNRVAMAPMTRSRATADHVPTPMMAEHYAARADAGLLITEGTAPDGNGCGYPRIPGLWNDDQVAGWRAVTDAVHAKGGRIAVQLMHTGRVTHPLNQPDGSRLLAPSAVPLDGVMYTDQQGPQPHPLAEAMTTQDIDAAIAGFVHAARNAIRAGFDLVELHGANGYLIDQFLSPNTNTRDDQWGGGIEGRARFALAVAQQVSAAIGADRVGIRLSPFGVFNGITPWASLDSDFIWLAQELGRLGIAYVHLVDHSSMGAPPVPAALKAGIREAFGGSIILSGGYDKSRAEADLAAGKGHLVAFGRPFLANPDLLNRLQTDAALNPPDFGSFYTPGDKGYNDYPVLAAAT